MKKYNKERIDILSVSKTWSLFFPNAVKVVFVLCDEYGVCRIYSSVVPLYSVSCGSDLVNQTDAYVLMRGRFFCGFKVSDFLFQKFFCSLFKGVRRRWPWQL